MGFQTDWDFDNLLREYKSTINSMNRIKSYLMPDLVYKYINGAKSEKLLKTLNTLYNSEKLLLGNLSTTPKEGFISDSMSKIGSAYLTIKDFLRVLNNYCDRADMKQNDDTVNLKAADRRLNSSVYTISYDTIHKKLSDYFKTPTPDAAEKELKNKSLNECEDDVTNLKDKISELNRECDLLKEKCSEYQNDLDKAQKFFDDKSSFRDEALAATLGQCFQDKRKKSYIWANILGGAGLALTILIIILVFLEFYYISGLKESENSSFFIYKASVRITLLAIGIWVAAICFKERKCHLHSIELNDHRANLCRTYISLSEKIKARENPEERKLLEHIIIQLSQMTDTGFVGKGSNIATPPEHLISLVNTAKSIATNKLD